MDKVLTRIPKEIIETLGLKRSKMQAGKSFVNDAHLYDYDYSDKSVEVTFAECDTDGEYLDEGKILLYLKIERYYQWYKIPVSFKSLSKEKWDEFIKFNIESMARKADRLENRLKSGS